MEEEDTAPGEERPWGAAGAREETGGAGEKAGGVEEKARQAEEEEQEEEERPAGAAGAETGGAEDLHMQLQRHHTLTGRQSHADMDTAEFKKFLALVSVCIDELPTTIACRRTAEEAWLSLHDRGALPPEDSLLSSVRCAWSVQEPFQSCATGTPRLAGQLDKRLQFHMEVCCQLLWSTCPHAPLDSECCTLDCAIAPCHQTL